MSNDDLQWANFLVDEYVGERLKAVGDIPGLRSATAALTALTLGSAKFEQLFRTQLQQLRHPASQAIPDAYLANEATVENSVQHAAAGLRSAMAQTGQLVDGRIFERDLEEQLTDEPRFAIRAELARIARPTTRPEVLRWSIPPAPWADDTGEDSRWPPPGYDGDHGERFISGGADALARVEDGVHADWVQVGLIETQRTLARRYPQQPARSVTLGVGLEAASAPRPAGTLPFVSNPWTIWTTPWDEMAPSMDAQVAAALIKSDDRATVAIAHNGPGGRGLGEPRFALVPILPLVVALGLRPTSGLCGFSLGDRDGPALVGRQWRGHPVHDGNYMPTYPAVNGADLVMRPDAFERTCTILGEERCRAGLSVKCDESSGRPDDDDLYE